MGAGGRWSASPPAFDPPPSTLHAAISEDITSEELTISRKHTIYRGDRRWPLNINHTQRRTIMFEKCKANKYSVLAAILICGAVYSGTAAADAPALYDGKTGKYLGRLSDNPYEKDSVSNPYGRYGNPFSPDSINNAYGKYGSPYSNSSANNPYATNAPVIIDTNAPRN